MTPPENVPGTTPDPVLATRVARAELMKRVLIVVTTVMVAAALVLSLVILFQVRATQQAGSPAVKAARDAAEAARATNKQILDCLDPKGDEDSCYQRSQDQTADAVGQIGAGNILAVVCALQVPNGTPLDAALEQVTNCVSAKLAEQGS